MTYHIERREVGARKYRVTKPSPTLGRVFVLAYFWTEKGARAWIARRTWKAVS